MPIQIYFIETKKVTECSVCTQCTTIFGERKKRKGNYIESIGTIQKSVQKGSKGEIISREIKRQLLYISKIQKKNFFSFT